MTSDPTSSEAQGVPKQRMHPAGIAVLGAHGLGELLVPMVIALIATNGGSGIFRALGLFGLGLLLLAVLVVRGVIQWALTTFSVDSQGVQHRSRFISVKETVIPLERIQSVDIEQGPIQKLFGVVGLTVRAAGGDKKADIKLRALKPETAEAVRSFVGSRDVAAVAEQSEEHFPHVKLSTRTLLKAAMTGGHLAVVLPALAVVLKVGGEALGDGDFAVAGVEASFSGTAIQWIIVGVVVITIPWLLSAIGSIVVFGNFEVERQDKRLRIRRGLFIKRDATVPVRRIQAIEVSEGVLRQPFGLVALRVEVAGYAKEATTGQVLFPLLHRSQIDGFLKQILPEFRVESVPLIRPPVRSRRRYIILPVSILLLLAGLLLFSEPLASGLVVLAAPLVCLWGWLRWRDAGVQLHDGFCVMRHRRLARKTLICPAQRLQGQSLRQNPFQRRGDVADVGIRIGAKGKARVRHLDVAVARQYWGQLCTLATG